MWMPLSEAARRLKLSTRTIRRMIDAKTLNSRMENGRRLVLIENKSSHGDEDSHGGNAVAVPVQRRGLADERLLRPLFDAYEALGDLLSDYASVLEMSIMIARAHHSEDKENLRKRESYKPLFLGVHKCHQDIKSIVFDVKNPIPEQRLFLEQVYLTMIDVRRRWKQFSVRSRIAVKDNKESIMIDGIIENIKRGLIHSTNHPY